MLLHVIEGTAVASRGGFQEPSLPDSPRCAQAAHRNGTGGTERKDPRVGVGTGGGGDREQAPPALQAALDGRGLSNTCCCQPPTSAL